MPKIQPLQIYNLTIASVIQFILLTILAMFLYAGGTYVNPNTTNYQFFQNFFSDLGLTVAISGQPNTSAAILFFIALTLTGIALISYFLTFPIHFQHSPATKQLSRLGSFFGVVSGLGYMGVAFTPANLLLDAHVLAVQIAFTSFLVAVLLYVAAIHLQPNYPKVYAIVFLAYAVILSIYLILLFGGPSAGTTQGLLIQATGQKIVVYAAIICMFIQAVGARRQLSKV